MTYNLELSNLNCDVPKETKIRLLKEILGYTDEEATHIANESIKTIAINLTMEQVELIAKPFLEYDINVYMPNGEDYDDSFLDELGEPKEHYYDEPVIGCDHLIDPYTPYPEYPSNEEDEEEPIIQSHTKPSVECPYCHSTDTKKITNTSKVVHTALFGIWSIGRNAKNYHCNHCGADF